MLISKKFVFWGLLIGGSFIWSGVFSSPSGKLQVAFLDVGQGDSTFIETPNGNQILIDGGPDRRVLSELGKVMPANDRSIDLVIATHSDFDHLAGLISVLQNYSVGKVLHNNFPADSEIYAEWRRELEKRKIEEGGVMIGDRAVLDRGVIFDFLGPFPEDYTPKPSKPNDVMVVGRLVYKDNEFLFSGDIERGDELRLVRSGLELESDVLKIPHHGSKTSSTKLFLEKVKPREAVISVGSRNRYGHPAEVVLGRLESLGASILRTDISERIHFESDGTNIKQIE